MTGFFDGVHRSGDDRYVAALMTHGGLPRVELICGKPVWFGPDGARWRFQP